MKTAVGVYDDVEAARDLVHDLVERGIPREEISLVTRDESGEAEGVAYEVDYGADDPAEGAAEAALGGAVVGSLTGILVGLGGFALPGIGPVVAAGPIAAGLAGAGVGAVTGGLLGALVEWGIPEEEAEYYAESVRRGSTLVAVRVPEGRAEEVVEAMNDYDAIDIERRVAYWREEAGWEGYDADADPYDVEDIEDFRKKREAWRRKAEEAAHDGGLLSDFEDLDDVFREDYERRYADRGYPYTRWLPAYRFGYRLALDPRYRNRGWPEVEPIAVERWEEENEDEWEEFKGAVRRGWEEVKETVS